ncbi:MAG: pyrroline-5-carboxylate reductase [Actinomycetota bacterium]|nr:pyrroline-5-carboxylate reductase [Actinomycetota bacterium]
MTKLAVLGGGKMGEALVAGLLTSGSWKPEEIVVSDVRSDRLSELAGRYSVATTRDNLDAVADVELIVIAVKPQDMEGLLAEIAASVRPDQVVVSIAAAITTRFIEQRLEKPVPVVRAMPNTASLVHEGMTGLAGGSHAGDAEVARAGEVLERVGRVVTVSESHLDAVTAISGSGPAYFALLAEAMIEAGLLLGLSRDVSTELVVQTMLGSAKLLRDGGLHPVELREMVTSPGGTTTRAVRVLEHSGVRAAFLDAIRAAMERAQELAAPDSSP